MSRIRVLLLLAVAPALLLLASPAAATPPAVPADLVTAEVSFRGGGGLALHGTVVSPAAPSAEPRAGLVLVHGAGEGTKRAKLLGEAVEFARRGLAVLVYDKRTVGYTLFDRSFSALADDALGAVAALRARPGVDPAKVGLWGLSEGGWVVPLAASRSADVAFVVVVGANAQHPLRQQTWAVASGLRKAGVSGSMVERTEPALYRAIADGGLFPEAYYEPQRVLRQMRQPLLGIWGTDDLLTPPRESPPLIARALKEGGNTAYTMRFFPGADHAAHQTPDGGVTRLPALAPGYADLVGSWVSDVTSGRLPEADLPADLPAQAAPTVAVPPPAWWESALPQTAALVLFLVAFTAYPVVAVVRRVRGRSPVLTARAPRVLGAAGPVAVFGGFTYLMVVCMNGGKLASPGPILGGRPLIWLGLQALALAAVVATAMTVPAWRRATGAEKVRLGLLLAAGAVFLPWALYWGLLLP
ncbi:alpha/beta hydrolase [Nonomuraea sp. NPDC046570]|uniref:alpha/beta hydrolase family protein n=1 Tax=Nonomuraea sp. NPDC046570 TaxID=3155255 RepID=UPI0033EE9914